MHSSVARSVVLLPLLVGLITSCQGAPDGASPGQSSQALQGVHRVQAGGDAARQLLARGGRLIADYGGYALLDVDGARLAGLSKDAFALRDEYRELLLNAGTIDALDASAARLRETSLPATGKQFHLVQFAGPVKPEWYAGLQSTGVRVVTYIPHNAYLVWGDAASLSRLLGYTRTAPEVQWDGPYLNDYKLNPAVFLPLQPDGWQVQLVEDRALNADTLLRAAAIEKGRMIDQRALGYVNLVMHADRDAVMALAKQPDVVSIMPFFMPVKLDERANVIAGGLLTGNGPTGPGWLSFLTAHGFTQAQFDTSGFGVDVTDSGLDNATLLPNHYALYRLGDVTGTSRVAYARLVGTPNSGIIQGCDGHGTINSHIIGAYTTATGGPHSDAAGFRYNLGIAPFVKVGSSVIFDPSSFTFPDYEDLQSMAYADGMRVSSNSWGAAVFGAYNSDSQRYDALVRDAQPSGSASPAPGNQEMVIVFAAGNQGSGPGSVGSPATAKNVITAGAAENVHAFGGPDQCGIADNGADSANDIIFFSSRGPCQDGRKKPDLVAAGTHVSGGVFQASGQRSNPPGNPNGDADSCFIASQVCAGPGSNFWPTTQEWTTASSGTSHSTPLIAGGAALMRQHMINTTGGPPSSAMVKALLMNGARYMNGSGANDSLYSNNQGMGHLDLGASLDGTARFMRDEAAADLFTASGQTRTFNIFIADPAKPFRVTLAWTDAPGSTTGNAFNNDLDLTVTAGGNTYRGNVFTGANSATGGAADTRDNVENVFLVPGITGPATITVTATNINSDGVPGNASPLDQDFALVAYNVCNSQPNAPTGAAATVPGPNQIQIDWTPPAVGNVTEYHIYRGTTAGGPYTQVGTTASTVTTFTDNTVSGGTTYFYVVRAVDCAESVNSNETSALATGDCRIPPVFAGLTSATSAGSSTCGVNLAWSAATPSCAGPVTYSIYRSRTAGFTPGTATRIASGVSGTAFADTANLVYPNTYYYVVHAVEQAGSSLNEDTNTTERSVFPAGAPAGGINYFDNLDGTRPPNANAYWIRTGGSSTAINMTTCHNQSPVTSWRFGSTSATSCPGLYANFADARLTLGGNGSVGGINGFAFPPGATGTMTFRHAWDFDDFVPPNFYFDGAVLEYSTVGPTGPWAIVGTTPSPTQPYITAGGYNGTISTLGACWTGLQPTTNGSFLTTTVNLDALAGQTAWFAWHYSTDSVVTREGHYLDDVNITAAAFAACTPGSAPPGPAAQYLVTLPATSTAGASVTASLQALDAAEQVATGYNGTANLTTSDAQATVPPTATFTAGAVDVTVSFGTAGAQTLTAADAVDSTIAGTGGTIVTAGPPARLGFSVQPSNTTAGAAIAPAVRVRVEDQFGNLVNTATDSITVAIGSNPGGGTLNGTLTVSAVAGVASFSDLSIQQAGVGYTLAASSGTLTGATSSAFNITADVPADLRFRQQPTNSVAGAPFNPTVEVEVVDQYGNVNTTGTLAVTMSIENNPGGAVLLGTRQVDSASGVASFPDISLTRVGTGYTLNASSAVGDVTSSAFDVSPAAPHHLTITQQPGNTTVGATISAVVVTVRDRFENLATQSFAPISASLLGGTPGALLLGTDTVFANAGSATFNDLAVDRSGRAYALFLGSTGLFTTTTVAFDVAPNPAPVALQFGSQPTSSTAGAAISPAVTVRVVDGAGNTVVTATDAVTLALGSNPGGGTLSGTLTANAVNGVATFSGLSVNKTGTGYTMVAGAAALASATSSGFNVSAAAVAGLAFDGQPSNAPAGQAVAPAVTVRAVDAFGNLDASFGGQVTVALGGGAPGAVLSGTATATASGGVATFSDLSVDRAATGYTLAASSGALNPGTSSAFAISAGPAADLAFNVQPSNTRAGRSIAPAVTVEARDAFGNLATSFSGPVTVALGGGNPNATLSGSTVVISSGGTAPFSSLSVDKVGNGYALTASSTGLTSATSGAFNVTAGNGRQLAFGAQPSNAPAGQAITPAVTVEVRDEFGNVDTTFAGTVALALSGGSPVATLSGTTSAAASAGVATFSDLSVNKSGRGYTLSASASGVAGGASTPFNVGSGPPSKYALVGLGLSVTSSVEVAFTIQAMDAQDNVATDYAGTAAITSDDAAAVLPAGVTFASGVASNVKVTFKSTGVRRLTATDTAASTLTTSASVVVTNFPQPTVVITGPSNGTSVSGVVNVTAEATVAAGTTLTKLEIFVDGTAVFSGTSSPASASWDTAQLKAGTTHLIHAVASDAAGNVVQSTPLTVMIGEAGGCGCSTGAGGADMALLAAVGAALRMISLRRRRVK